ncbi:MAG: clostripain-related cysteine peptidase, partial [Candidatus Bathyarchaeia archaeon]
MSTKAEQSTEMPLQDNLTGIFDGGGQLMVFSSASSSASFTRHLMCKNYIIPSYDPIDPTTTFSPSDKQAVILTDVNISNTIEFRWYDRDNSSKAWVSCYNWTELAEDLSGYPYGPYHVAAYLSIAGYWPGVYFPRAYKVDVYLDGFFSFSEFFEVTNGGLDSPRTCENVDANGQPVNLKSRFTVGVDTQVAYYSTFDDMAYFDEETGGSHNFTIVWIQPDGTIYKTHSSFFPDYKGSNVTLNYWQQPGLLNDSISIDSTTPVGNWEVEVYVDSYYSNDSWIPYGPIATTPFIVGNQSVANWTFMVYLDSDNNLANVSISGQTHDLGIDVFLRLANVTSSPNFNIVVEMARAPSQDERYGNWTGAKRFDVKEGMTPTAENAVQDLGDVDMGDPNTLRDFVNWTINNYPANYLFLVLWDHGSGCMGICYDTTSGNDYLSLPKITQALTGIPAIIDDVLMDACGPSMLEVAYQIKDSANILIGPEGLGYTSNMPPYDAYLNNLSNDPSISPNAFAQDIVMNYTSWAYANAPWIQDATMTATDLTKMTSLAVAVDDFATTLTEKETLYHEQISLARNMTTGYPGPYQNSDGTYQTGYYIDLYDFASLVNATVPDEELRRDSSQVMTSIDNAVIMNLYINDPGTYGLAVFFPDEKEKYDYDTFATIYESTAFAINTPWDEFVKYHLSGFTLTIKTMCSNMPVKVDDDVYNTTAEGEIDVFLQPGTHTVNVTSVFSPGPDSQLVFVNWNDSYTSSTRTFNIENSDVTAEAVYELQYPLVIETNFGGQTEPPVGQYWCNASSPVPVRAIAPSAGAGENYTELKWMIQEGATNSSSTDNPINITMNGPINATALWIHEYFLTVFSQHGTPTPTTGWFEAGTPFNGSVTSPLSGSTGTQYVCTGWTGTGNVPSSGASLTTDFTLDQPSSIEWNWKTQYLLT